MDLTDTILHVVEEESSRGYVVTSDCLTVPAIPLTRSDVMNMPESVSRRLASYFVRLVDSDLNHPKPGLVYVPNRYSEICLEVKKHTTLFSVSLA